MNLLVIMELDFELILSGNSTLIYFDINGLGNSLGILIFAFEAIGNIFIIKDSMKEPAKFNWLFKKLNQDANANI